MSEGKPEDYPLWRPCVALAVCLLVSGFLSWGLIDSECFCSPEFFALHSSGTAGGAGNPVKHGLGAALFGAGAMRSIYLIRQHFKE